MTESTIARNLPGVDSLAVFLNIERDKTMPAPQDHEEPATLEFAASLDFEPWKDLSMPPTSAEWQQLENPHLVNARVAYFICKKTKPELVEMIERMVEGGDDEVAKNILHGLSDAKEFFQYFNDLLAKAEARMFSAGAVVALQDGDDPD